MSCTPFAINSLVGYQHAIEAPDAAAGNQISVMFAAV